MRTGHLVFAQIMRHLPVVAFARMVERHRAQHKVNSKDRVRPCLLRKMAIVKA